MNRRKFLGAAAKMGCGCVLAGGLGSCRGLTKRCSLCLGCKSDKVADHCAQCAMKTCAAGKNLSSCGQCDQFPCEKTKKFHSSGRDMAVVAEKSCYQIRETGYSSWLDGQPRRWSCTACGSLFSFKDETCPNCNVDVYSCKEEASDYRKS